MAPKVSEEYLEDRRQQILDAAVVCFSRMGFHQTTIEDIRLQAELSRGALYHYFKTKEDIIDAIRQRSSEQAEEIFSNAGEANDGMARLEDLINLTLRVMTSPESTEANRLALFLWAESLINERMLDAQLASFTPYLTRIAEHVGRAQQDGTIDSELDEYDIARVISGAMLGLQIQLAWEPDMDIEKAGKVLLTMLFPSRTRS